MTNSFRKKGLTLVEVMIVVIIMAVLLGITIGLGNSYVSTMQVKKDKELIVSLVEKMTTIARTSNYYQGTKYTYLDVIIYGSGMVGRLNTDDDVDSIEITKSEITGLSGSSIRVRMTPYALGCEYVGNESATGVSISQVSTINDDNYCFLWDLSVCKLQQQSCP